jgi:hypothetical protein
MPAARIPAIRVNQVAAIDDLPQFDLAELRHRETPSKRIARLEEGCDVVEMEAATFFAVAQFREIKLGQIVYGGDLVHPDGWDPRSWHGRSDSRRLLFDLAVKAVLKF